jgi:HEAT repeat protein
VLAAEAGELAVAAAQALAATGSATAQAPLLAALAEAPPPVRTAAAAALGAVGDVAAVAPLRAAAAGADADGALRRAVRQAVAEIQSRLSGAAPGQLSLAGDADAAGRLSLADTNESVVGRLSLADARDAAASHDGAGEDGCAGAPERRREAERSG